MQIQTLSSLATGLPPSVGNDAGQSRAQQAAAETSQIAEAVRVSPDAVQAAAKVADPAEVRSAVDKLNKTVSALNQSLQFSVDSDTKINVVKLVDVNSHEVIRQIPSEEVLNIAKAIDKLQGMLIQEKA